MKLIKGAMCVLLIFVAVLQAQDQKKSKAVFIEPRNEFWELIEAENEKFYEKETEPEKKIHMDFSGMDLPSSADQFERQWHQPPISQGNTGACWCFCTTSFFESEIKRLSGKEIKISEMYTVYWEFVEKARRFVQQRGDSYFAHGSMGNAVIRICRKYGAVPAKSYSGMLEGQKFHDHDRMFGEMESYLDFVAENNAWNEANVLANIKSILNHYMGEPPLKIIVDGREMTPLEYAQDALPLDLNDYVDLLSLKEKPYYQKVVYPAPDNWWLNDHYYNVPLDEFMAVVSRALDNGYTITLGGDTSEPGYDDLSEVAMVPTFDIPSAFIDEDARQLRWSNSSTTDDHGIHVVGMMQQDQDNWYLIKDSGSGSRNGPNKGYRFYHQDYIKLKMLDMMVHRDIVEDLLKKFPAEDAESVNVIE